MFWYMWQIARCDFLTCWLAIRRSGSPIGNQFQNRTMVNDGGIYHTKINNNIRCVYVLQCMSLVPYMCVYKRIHCDWGYIYCGSINASASNLLINVVYWWYDHMRLEVRPCKTCLRLVIAALKFWTWLSTLLRLIVLVRSPTTTTISGMLSLWSDSNSNSFRSSPGRRFGVTVAIVEMAKVYHLEQKMNHNLQ